MDFGLLNYISDKIYGSTEAETSSVVATEEGKTVTETEENKPVQTEEAKITDSEIKPENVAETKKEETKEIKSENIVEEIKKEEIVSPERQVSISDENIQKRIKELAEITKLNKSKLDNKEIKSILTEGVASPQDPRETKNVYYNGIRTSLKCRYQVIPGTNVRDGIYEEFHYKGIRIMGPLKMKVSYVNDKKHGTEYHYDENGTLTEQLEYNEGQYVKTWYEYIFGK